MWEDLLPGSRLDPKNRYLSERDLCRAFLRSRMRVVDVMRGRGFSRCRNLGFEDFLEALVRVALMVPDFDRTARRTSPWHLL